MQYKNKDMKKIIIVAIALLFISCEKEEPEIVYIETPNCEVYALEVRLLTEDYNESYDRRIQSCRDIGYNYEDCTEKIDFDSAHYKQDLEEINNTYPLCN